MSARAKGGETEIFRQVSPKAEAWAAFKGLSPLALALMFRLVGGPETTQVPGLVLAGKRALAEQLGCTDRNFGAAARELEARGLIVTDWDAEMVFVPGQVRFARPANPNIVKGWRKTWERTRPGPVQARAKVDLWSAVAPLGPSFAEALAVSFGDPIPESFQGSHPGTVPPNGFPQPLPRTVPPNGWGESGDQEIRGSGDQGISLSQSGGRETGSQQSRSDRLPPVPTTRSRIHLAAKTEAFLSVANAYPNQHRRNEAAQVWHDLVAERGGDEAALAAEILGAFRAGFLRTRHPYNSDEPRFVPKLETFLANESWKERAPKLVRTDGDSDLPERGSHDQAVAYPVEP